MIFARRALFLEPAGNLWGSERALLDLVEPSLRGHTSWNVAVCCPAEGPLLPELRRMGAQVFPTFRGNLHRAGRGERLLAAAGLLAAAARFRPAVIHVNQAGATRIAIAVARVVGARVVAHVRIHEESAYLQALGARERIAAVICVSDTVRALFPAGKALSDRLATVYDGYTPRCEWALPARSAPDAPFGCVGRLARGKGQDLLVRAAALLAAHGDPADVAFLGEACAGDDFGLETRRLADALGLAPRVRWLGFDPHPVERMKEFRAVVLPSHRETLGRVILEAWDAGVVPLAWRGSGGPAEIIRASGGGLLYDRQEPESLAAGLRSLVRLPESERSRLVARGRAWMVAHCEPVRSASLVADVWRAVATGNPVGVES